jgi:addiction module RelE/StbE family toxin
MRTLLRSNAFIRSAKRILKRQPQLSEDLHSTLELLAADAFHPRLRTHKLKGDLQNSWACSVDYDIRIVFKFVTYDKNEAILLESIGSHEEVY